MHNKQHKPLTAPPKDNVSESSTQDKKKTEFLSMLVVYDEKSHPEWWVNTYDNI